MGEVKVGEFAASMPKAAESSGNESFGAKASETARIVGRLRRGRMPKSRRINRCLRRLRQASDQSGGMRSRRLKGRRFERKGVERSAGRSFGLKEEEIVMIWFRAGFGSEVLGVKVEFFPAVTSTTGEAEFAVLLVVADVIGIAPVLAEPGLLAGEVGSFEVLPVVSVDASESVVMLPRVGTKLAFESEEEKVKVKWK